MITIHTPFAEKVVAKHDALLLDYGPEEQTARAVAALERISAVKPLAPLPAGTVIDLAGFGEAPVVYVTEDEEYLLLSDIAEALGWPLHKADAWARLQHGYAVRDQRDHDEERGDGRLGWECLLDYIDLRLDLIEDDPEAKPDAGGRRWSHSGDWLISRDRLPALIMSSPWSKEFMDNSLPAFGHAMRKVWGDKLKDIPTVTVDGTPTGGNAYDDMFRTDGMTEEEALRRARRGPALDGGTA
ncbi:hypothetical protein [Streptomyces sp. SID12501]|uniref:Uncharacterized protein n=1 Tax=Streptomyces sp. SID12501 TaxID=2706042 RepID=A0A6B3C5T4_9ACTN|nr:hypothetical protein [Streptomyces sp. SID12501]NEC92201.1 hypothetical protein [Streptomyces sp. SID12501]